MITNKLTTVRIALGVLVLLPILITAGWRQAPQTAALDHGQGFIFGRVTTDDGEVYEGRMRWGGSEEAYWSEYFNGVKNENVWATHVASERLKERTPVEIFGFRLGTRERSRDLGRPFMARFGDITRIDTQRSTFQVTLKSGTVHELNRFASDDLADGVRVWDASRGMVDIDEWAIRSIEFLPTPRLDNAPGRLHGTVHAQLGTFTGFIQWNREEGVVTDELSGRGAEGDLSLPFHTISSISRASSGGARVMLRGDREVALSGNREVGEGNRGVYVDDPRFGRVLVSWEAFERIDFSQGGDAPSFDAFPPGVALAGTVTTCAGRRMTGRLVYDLDESETTETLDAPLDGVDYSIPFGLLSAVTPSVCGGVTSEHAQLEFHDGTELTLETEGDLGDAHAGILIFEDRRSTPEYVRWNEIERIDLDSH